MAEKKSCYVLELSVQPGGSRWAETHVYTQPAHLRLILEEFCANDGGQAAYHALWYGATLAVWVVQKGAVAKFIDLHPFIRAHPPEGKAFLLSDEKARKAAIEEDEDDGDGMELFEVAEDYELELFWDGIEEQLPPLKKPLLSPGEEVKVSHPKRPKVDTYSKDTLMFGSYDQEAGMDLDPPFELDDEDENADDEEDD